jgi:cobaltochelatase CobS
MQTVQEQIEELQNIIATATEPDIIELARMRLQEITPIVQPQMALSGDSDASVLAILAALQNALALGGASVNAADLRKLINEELAKRKITDKDLSPSLLAMLNSARAVSITANKLFGVSLSQNVQAKTLERPLVQMVLSDLMARNNVYLYGGAGTGKTFLAEEIADMLGWERITLNCNQFTSPLDILGGQTIDGYQEGKLSMAWSNQMVNADGSKREVAGAVLILDELPKIDPNTAGILNEALAKVKDFKYDTANGTIKAPTIRNGKNEVLELRNLFVIATGNVPLNTIDPDYEANFKQDLSLQDRFIGSTYKVFVDYRYECNEIMKGYAFIWIFMVQVREAVIKNRATGQAFVSLRIMVNLKWTYSAFREVVDKVSNTKGNISNDAITNPKTIINSLVDFFNLFKPAIKDSIINEVDFEGFKRIVAEKNKLPFDSTAPNFDTPQELAQTVVMINNYEATQKIQ